LVKKFPLPGRERVRVRVVVRATKVLLYAANSEFAPHPSPLPDGERER